MESKKIMKKCVWYMLEGISHVIDKIGPREPGSEEEDRAQDYVTKELASYCDEVSVEEFSVHPKAFMGFVPVTGGLMLAAVATYWTLPAAAAVLSVMGVSVAGLQFLKYKKVLDPFFPRRTSKNVLATRRSFNEPKRRIILSGHIDSAYEWRYQIIGGPALIKVVIGGAVLASIFKTGTDIVSMLARGTKPGLPEGKWKNIGLAQLIGVPFFVSLLFFSDFKKVVPGANDNLTGTFTAMGVMRYLEKMNKRYDHTEVCCLITGSEEAGLRGAKAYVARHCKELMAIDTMYVALETFRDMEHMAVYDRDMSGTVRNHPGASDLVQRAGLSCGVDLPMASVYVGSSDAAAFSEAGIPATALAAMDPAPPRYYHSRFDNKDNINPDCIEKALCITLKTIDLFDEEKGLKSDV